MLDFFSEKITKIRTPRLDSKSPNYQFLTTAPEIAISRVISMDRFKLLTESDIQKIIQNSKTTTCDMDIIPTHQLKAYLENVLPIVTEIVNCSLTSGKFPSVSKDAVIGPMLKKKGLPLELKNYRPISNLSFLSKILGSLAAFQQVVEYVEENIFLPS